MRPFKIILLLFMCEFSALTYAKISKDCFRNDYIYIKSTESFYKIHTEPKTWFDAKKTCAMEDASLFYPIDKEEADIMGALVNNTQPFLYWLFIGISDILTNGAYETIDGVPITLIYHKWAQGEPNDRHPQNCVTIKRDGTLNDENCAIEYPFACKKTLASLQRNQQCTIPNKE